MNVYKKCIYIYIKMNGIMCIYLYILGRTAKKKNMMYELDEIS